MSKYTAFRCPEDLLELAKIKARRDRRSLSNYIITLIERDVQDLIVEGEPAGTNGDEEHLATSVKKRR
jgi:predicted CopG family antitoxin